MRLQANKIKKTTNSIPIVTFESGLNNRKVLVLNLVMHPLTIKLNEQTNVFTITDLNSALRHQ